MCATTVVQTAVSQRTVRYVIRGQGCTSRLEMALQLTNDMRAYKQVNDIGMFMATRPTITSIVKYIRYRITSCILELDWRMICHCCGVLCWCPERVSLCNATGRRVAEGGMLKYCYSRHVDRRGLRLQVCLCQSSSSIASVINHYSKRTFPVHKHGKKRIP